MLVGALAGRLSCPQGAPYLCWQIILTRYNDRVIEEVGANRRQPEQVEVQCPMSMAHRVASERVRETVGRCLFMGAS